MSALLLNFKREVRFKSTSSSIDFSHSQYNNTSFIKFFMAVQEARTLRKPKENKDPANDRKYQSKQIIYVYIARDEPELKCDIGHSKPKN